MFKIPLPGGHVARIPLDVLRQYIDGEAKAAHTAPAPGAASPSTGAVSVQAGEHHIHIHIHVDGATPAVAPTGDEDDDVVAHSLSVDPTTGTSEWHTDYEQGECEYTDASGFPQRIIAWHRHPFGTEYTEIYEG
ncbi:MAG: hypothetical protein KC731_26805 [Myxococcales bacterium]|nr:hypothetical protein [Myxococcales bacterium]